MSRAPSLAAAQEAVAKFWNSPNTTDVDRLGLMNYVGGEPTREPVRTYLHDLDRRLALADEIQQLLLKHPLSKRSRTSPLWAALLVAPVSQIEQLVGTMKNPWAVYPQAVATSFASLLPGVLKIFLGKQLDTAERAANAGFDKRLKLDSSRSKEEKNNTLLRDAGQCVVTGDPFPDVCHIFPFMTAENKEQTSTALHALSILYGDSSMNQLLDLLASPEAQTDTSCNMLCLSPFLHRLWGKALCGFEPIAMDETSIKLKFHWLTPNTTKFKGQIDFKTNPNAVFKESNFRITHSQTLRPVTGGELITVKAVKPSLLPSWHILALQWDLVRVCSLCAAAEAEDEIEEDEEEDDDAESAND